MPLPDGWREMSEDEIASLAQSLHFPVVAETRAFTDGARYCLFGKGGVEQVEAERAGGLGALFGELCRQADAAPTVRLELKRRD